MKRTVIALLIVLLFLPLCIRAEGLLPQYRLSLLDKAEHSPLQFLEIIKKIQHYYPAYSADEIADTIAFSYYKLNEGKPAHSMYEVAQGISRFSSSDGLGIALQILAVSYMQAQL